MIEPSQFQDEDKQFASLRSAEILERITDAFVALDANWRYTYVNRKAAEIFGRKPEDLIGKHIWTEFPEGVGQPFYHAYHKAMAEQVPIQIEEYYPPYDRWFENRIYPSPNGLSIYFQDITERKRAEEELRASGQQLRSIIRNSPGAVYRCGYAPHWTIDYISDAITEISGYPASDFIHDRVRSYVSMIHPDDWPRVEAEAARCLEAKAPYEVEYRIFRADASVRWVSDRGQGIYDEKEKLVFLDGIVVDITERKQVEAALKERERQYFLLLSELPGMAYRCKNDPDWTVQFVSEGCLALTGYYADELRNNAKTSLGKLIHPDDQNWIWKKCQINLDARKPCRNEYRIITKNGTVKWVWDQAHGIYSASGVLLAVEGFITDISDRKQAEEEIKKREKLLADSQQLAQLGSWEWDIAMNRTIWSDELYRISGLTPQELTANYDAFLRTVHPDDRERVDGIVRRAMNDHQPFSFEYRVVWPDGTVHAHYAHGEVILDPAGRPIRMHGFAQDVTVRKRAEEALQESEAKFRSLSEEALAGVVVIQDGRFKYVNPALCEMMGYSKDEMLAPSTVLDLVAEEDHGLVREQLRRRMEGEVQSVRFSFRARKKDGSLADLDVYGSRITLDGRPAVMSTVLDITERKRAEEELKRSYGQLRALSQRLVDVQEIERRNIALELHDQIGQVLTGLKLTLEMCLTRPADRVGDGLKEAKAMVDDLVSEVRDLSLRLRPSMLDDLGLLPTLLWHFEHYSDQTRVHVAFKHSALGRRFGPPVETAAYRIIQEALTNVARHSGVKEAEVRCEADPDAFRIEIEDHGVGFDPSVIRPVSSGLTGMRERAELLGGTFSIKTVPGSGTRLTIRLPLLKAGAPEREGGR